jgi:hypothetical protein
MTLRVYIDTSVVGGCFDDEFVQESRSLMEMAHEGRITLVISDLLARELDDAPPDVRAVLAQLSGDAVERVQMNEESERLRSAYLDAGVVGEQHGNDAHHVALATIARVDAMVSWNFRHVVHLDRIRLFNSVNLREGYPVIEIRSPRELV